MAQAANFRPGGWTLMLVTAFLNLRYPSLHPLWLIAAGALMGLSGGL